jgi:hypothetical protein
MVAPLDGSLGSSRCWSLQKTIAPQISLHGHNHPPESHNWDQCNVHPEGGSPPSGCTLHRWGMINGPEKVTLNCNQRGWR